MTPVWSRRALGELRRIGDRIAADNPPAAQALVVSIREQVARLARFPLLGRRGYADTRELVVHPSYLVTYRARGTRVEVLQVWHVAQRRP